MAALLAKYAEIFKSSPEAAVLAAYGLIHLILLPARELAGQVKALLRVLGVK